MISTRMNNKMKMTGQMGNRRLITQPDQITQTKSIYQNIKSSERAASKSKYLDVVSKVQFKTPINPNHTFKLSQHKKIAGINRILRTQNDQGSKTRKITTNSISNHQPLTNDMKYQIVGTAGKGTFGVVYVGKIKDSGQKIAIKKVLQDKRYKNRQLQILKILKHPNILQMKDYYMTNQGDNQFLNVVMDFYEENLYQVIKRKEISGMYVKVFMYQMLRGLNYLNIVDIAHRDIKPHNILVDRMSNKVVICDFGSAKQLVKGQSNLAYICSRCYRAPELIFGATDYTPQIDMWSLGCVLVQMINGEPPFVGDSQMDQLIEIIKILGTPTWQDVYEMNSKYSKTQYGKFPYVKPSLWKNHLKTKDQKLIDLVIRILAYSPTKRLTPIQALTHPFFDDLRNQSSLKQIKQKIIKIPQLFNFSKDEIQSFGMSKELLLPSWNTGSNETRIKNEVKTVNVKNSVSIKKKILQKVS